MYNLLVKWVDDSVINRVVTDKQLRALIKNFRINEAVPPSTWEDFYRHLLMPRKILLTSLATPPSLTSLSLSLSLSLSIVGVIS